MMLMMRGLTKRVHNKVDENGVKGGKSKGKQKVYAKHGKMWQNAKQNVDERRPKLGKVKGKAYIEERITKHVKGKGKADVEENIAKHVKANGKTDVGKSIAKYVKAKANKMSKQKIPKYGNNFEA